MQYESPNNRRGGRSSRGGSSNGSGLSGASRGSSRTPERVNLSGGSYHGPRGTQQRSGGRMRRGGGVPSLTKGKGNGGYPLRARSINFQGSRGRRSADRRTVLLAALAVVLAILVVVGVSSCIRGCASAPSDEQATVEQNQIDSRVAVGVSDELTNRFKAELDRGDALASIAANADKYDDTALLDLALAQPEAIDFVASYLDVDKTAQPYGEAASKGTVPELYCWDARWGAVDYGGHALALTGSGPTAFSMAYMALTGNNDKTPADIAALATEKDAATGDSGTASSFYEAAADELGLTVSSHASSADSLTQVLDAGVYLLVEAKAGTLTDTAHWVLVVTENADGTVVVYDPTDPSVSKREWSASTIAGACDTFYGVSAKSTDTASAEE